MIPLAGRWHRWGLAALLAGNAVAFAGVDPPARALSALLLLALAVDLSPEHLILPRLHRLALGLFALVVVLQLLPWPAGLRALLQPGLRAVSPEGWFSLSLAPWASVETAAMWVMAVITALVAARMAATRSGLPGLLWILALGGGLLALLGLGTEGGLPGRVLMIRANTGGGDPYGPFVNSNHFAVAMELTLPAAAALLAVAVRHTAHGGRTRPRAVAGLLGAGALAALALAALLRCQSRGGPVVLAAAALLTAPLWRRYRPGRRWPWAVAGIVLLAAAGFLAWTRLPGLAEDFQQLFAIQGVEGNSRWDVWAGTLRLWARAPVLGVGLGAYRHAAGLDSPPTGAAVLEQAHNDWLEWGATAGAVGMLALLLAVAWVVRTLRPSCVRRFRFEFRYAMAAAALALAAAGLHETIGFALQTPLNRYIAAVWVGLLWGLERSNGRSPIPTEPPATEGNP